MWPYVDSAVSDIGLQRLDKALKERRARWMLDVAVEQCVLGHPCTPYSSNECHRDKVQRQVALTCTHRQMLLARDASDVSLSLFPLKKIAQLCAGHASAPDQQTDSGAYHCNAPRQCRALDTMVVPIFFRA